MSAYSIPFLFPLWTVKIARTRLMEEATADTNYFLCHSFDSIISELDKTLLVVHTMIPRLIFILMGWASIFGVTPFRIKLLLTTVHIIPNSGTRCFYDKKLPRGATCSLWSVTNFTKNALRREYFKFFQVY